MKILPPEVRAARVTVEQAKILRSPLRMTVSEAAQKYVFEGGRAYDPAITPYMVEPADVLTSRDFTACCMVAPSQSGKTRGLIDNWIAHTVMCDPTDLQLVEMSQHAAKEHTLLRINRMHRESPEIRKQLMPRRKDDSDFRKQYRSGNYLLVAWPTINQLSGKTLPKIALTDYDRMPQNVDGEGSPFVLAGKRTTKYLSGAMTAVESSPGFDYSDRKWQPKTPHEAPPVAGILSIYNQGDRRRWYWPCPHCEDYFTPKMSPQAFWWPEHETDLQAVAEQTQLICNLCGQNIAFHYRREMQARATWVREHQSIDKQGYISGEPRHSNIASFWLHGAAAAFTTWGGLVTQYLEGMQTYDNTGDSGPVKSSLNTGMCLPYLIPGKSVDRQPHELEARADKVEKRQVPRGVRFLLATIDVQKNRFVVQVEGFGVDLESWIVDRFNIKLSNRYDDDDVAYKIDPATYQEDWNVLIANAINKTYPLSDGSGREMPILAVACDSGGEPGVTEKAYEFWRSLRRKRVPKGRFWLVKGGSAKNAPRTQVSYPDSRGRSDRNASQGDVPVIMLNTNMLKDALSAHLSREEPGPRYVHFPDWLGAWFYEELTAESRTDKGWEIDGKRRNESFDLCAYARALLAETKAVNAEKIDWENPPPWAREWDENSGIAYLQQQDGDASDDEPPKPAPRRKKRRGTVSRSKYLNR